MSPAGDVTMTPEQYALGVLRRHRDSMTRPDFQSIADDSALTAAEVHTLWEKLLAGRAPKPSAGGPVLKAVTPEARSQGLPAEPPPWRSAEDHPSAKIRRLHTKALNAITALEEALAADSEHAKLRAKEARLKAELAKVRDQLAGGGPTKTPCPECGDLIGPSAQAQALHRSRSRKHKATR